MPDACHRYDDGCAHDVVAARRVLLASQLLQQLLGGFHALQYFAADLDGDYGGYRRGHGFHAAHGCHDFRCDFHHGLRHDYHDHDYCDRHGRYGHDGYSGDGYYGDPDFDVGLQSQQVLLPELLCFQ